MTNVKVVPRAKFQQEIDNSVTNGWKLKRHNKDMAILSKKDGSLVGHLIGRLVLIMFTAWVTAFVGKSIYAMYERYIGDEELKIKVE